MKQDNTTTTGFTLFNSKALVLVLFLFFTHSVFASEIYSGKFRFTYDHMTLPGQEKMGLLGGNYFLKSPSDYFFGGLGVYGAIYGERGGFFTGGFEGGANIPVTKYFSLASGLFVGGGGGGAAPQGGGLMIRPYGEIRLNIAQNQLGMGMSRVWFPNGEIVSDQIYLSVERPFSLYIAQSAVDRGVKSLSGRSNRRIFSPQLLSYFPPEGHRGRSGKLLEERIDVVGIRWKENLNGNWWGDFETGGAWGGQVDGLAQVFVGAAYELNVSDYLYLFPGIQLGAAGGGDVHTGGGLLGRLSVTLLLPVHHQWSVQAEAGLLNTLDGELSGYFASAGLAYSYSVIRPPAARTQSSDNDIIWADFRLRAGVQRYAKYLEGNGRKNDQLAHIPVDQVSLKIDSFINPYVFVTGQALGAFDGDAGGYAVGLIGGGLSFPLIYDVSLDVELLAGAAGGGGIDVGSGRIVQPMMNLSWKAVGGWSIDLGAGLIKAIDGELKSVVAEAGIAYRFAVPHGL